MQSALPGIFKLGDGNNVFVGTLDGADLAALGGALDGADLVALLGSLDGADLVVVDRDASWTVRRDTLVGRSANTPLLGRTLRGAVQLTMLHGSVAWQAGTTS